jgi:hypothetical protein
MSVKEQSMLRCRSLMVELPKISDNADSVVLLLTVRCKVSSDATLLRLLPSENRFKQETIHSLGYIIYTLSCK